MGAHFAGRANNHRTAAAAWDYHIREHRQLGYGETVPVFRGEAFVGWADKAQFTALAAGKGPDGEKLRRPHPRASQGELFHFSLPARVTGAMKLAGLLDSPRRAFGVLATGVRPAMARLNAHAYGRTTGGKQVKGDLLWAPFVGHSNRAGELAPGVSVWVFPTVEAGPGRHYALYSPPLFRTQKEAQGAFHLGVAHALRERAGVVCGPDGNSFVAFGVKAATRRSAEVREQLKAFRARGPRARQRAARTSRGPKRDVSWADAVREFPATATRSLRRAAKAWSAGRERRLARRCVEQGFAYCGRNASRFTRGDAYAAGAHLALPHVRARVFSREFDRLSARPERFGLAVVKRYPDGKVLYGSADAARAEAGAGLSLWALSRRAGGGLTPRQVVKALAGRGVTQAQFAAVRRLADGRQAVLDPGAIKDPAALRATARAYAAAGRDVYAVGRAAGAAVGVPAYTANGLAESLTRTSHLRALWRGLRTPGSLSHKLWVAEQIRAHGHTKLRKGSLVVLSAAGTRDAAAVGRLAEAVRKAKGKLVVTGPGAAEYDRLAQTQLQAAAPGMGRGAHP